MIRADEIVAGRCYAGDDNPESLMLIVERVEKVFLNGGPHGIEDQPGIRMHYRWLRHRYVEDYNYQSMTTIFTSVDEIFEYHEEIYAITELP